ncbi:MAG: hypothetical protein B6I31_00855 [Desulfobacteraceae bacterium 4572_19]|nr:MAG: hypothetical protein B6I31_00855 [Desulfobacteraceae bacterium 4572_19]
MILVEKPFKVGSPEYEEVDTIMKVPTGDILTIKSRLNLPLEFLSVGDYGKENNVKADFLNLKRDIVNVPHSKLQPLSEKWVITISTQHGCSMGCLFCDAPSVSLGINATYKDILCQVQTALDLHPEIKHSRVNVLYARMGEPTWNRWVIKSAYYFKGLFDAKGWDFYPIISTMMPKNNSDLQDFLDEWMDFKAEHDAGLQISVNTTSTEARNRMMPMAMDLYKVASMLDYPVSGRKITLNFALTGEEINAKYLKRLFDPERFICKLTPMYANSTSIKNGIVSHPYAEVEESLKAEGYDVIVFTPSKEEEESKITCGSVVLCK